jgi:hypothetical protein
MKTLVAGWFSFERMGATAGDLLARDLVCERLAGTGHDFDIATAPPFDNGVDWRSVKASDYSQVVFVCGPCGNGPPLNEFLSHFDRCRMIGVNLSMLQPLEQWNPFDLLLERDSSARCNPDITFLSQCPTVPVVGVVLVDPQAEYGDRAMHTSAEAAIRRLLAAREAAAIPIDTRLDENRTGFRTAAEVESTIARMDVVLTTRLHGMVLALKNGVPVIPIDPIAGGAKILRQAETICWPIRFCADAVDDTRLEAAFAYCLTDEARREARLCAAHAARAVETLMGDLRL